MNFQFNDKNYKLDIPKDYQHLLNICTQNIPGFQKNNYIFSVDLQGIKKNYYRYIRNQNDFNRYFSYFSQPNFYYINIIKDPAGKDHQQSEIHGTEVRGSHADCVSCGAERPEGGQERIRRSDEIRG